MADASGFPYPNLEGSLEAVMVVVDDQDCPVMAAAAERIVQLYLFASAGSPFEKLRALRLLDTSMKEELTRKGYREANAFLPPEIARSFGRRLARTFGWVQNWPSWCRNF